MRHELKIWPQYFALVVNGSKTWELRKNDRPFAVGDTLLLKEFDPATGSFSGRHCTRLVVGVMPSTELVMVEPGYCLLSITQLPGVSDSAKITRVLEILQNISSGTTSVRAYTR